MGAATDLDFEPFDNELTRASGISLREQVKWADFRDDARRQGLDLAHCPGWQLPGEVFVGFKGLMLLQWPPRWWGNCLATDLAPGGNPSFEVDRRRFETITRRLHWVSGVCSAVTLVACVLAICGMKAQSLLLLAAGLPALAASAHGILATGEYIKLGESSTATADAIGRLMGDVDARLAEGTGGEPVKSLAPLVPEVRAFWNLVTSEATGWQATLRDKNVPLP